MVQSKKVSSHKVQEGNVFAIPLTDDACAVCLTTRVGGRGKTSMQSYVFRPATTAPSYEDALKIVEKRDVLDVVISGTDALKNDKWPVIGSLPGFRANDWPVPLLMARDGSITEFDQVDFMKRLRVFRTTGPEIYYQDCAHGLEALRISLGKKLGLM